MIPFSKNQRNGKVVVSIHVECMCPLWTAFYVGMVRACDDFTTEFEVRRILDLTKESISSTQIEKLALVPETTTNYRELLHECALKLTSWQHEAEMEEKELVIAVHGNSAYRFAVDLLMLIDIKKKDLPTIVDVKSIMLDRRVTTDLTEFTEGFDIPERLSDAWRVSEAYRFFNSFHNLN